MRRLVITVVAVLGLTLASVSTALADPPEHFSFDQSGTSNFHCDFPIEYFEHVEGIAYSIRGRDVTDVRGNGWFKAHGRTVLENWAYHQEIDTAGFISQTGLLFHFWSTSSFYNEVDAGRVVYDPDLNLVSEVGVHPVIDRQQAGLGVHSGPFCAALA